MNTYKVSEFAALVGVSVNTLQRWDRAGKLVALRTPTNRRFYTDEHLAGLRGWKAPERQLVVVYCRVSSAGQKNDLANQRQVLEQFCAARGLAVDEWITEIGGGLNFKRKRFLDLLDRVLQRQIGVLVVAHKDRLSRFGFDLVSHLCEISQCDLIVMNTQSVSPEQEMVEDLMTIVHCFSSRLYGLRNYRTTLKQALTDDQSP